MGFSLVAVTPSHHCAPELAIAAVRAGEIGLLDVGARPIDAAAEAIGELSRASRDADRWGIRWEALESSQLHESLDALSKIAPPYLLLAASEFDFAALVAVRKAV